MLNQILNMNAGGAYGGGKAGGAFDPLAFAMKPQVVIRALCWVSFEGHFKLYIHLYVCTYTYINTNILLLTLHY